MSSFFHLQTWVEWGLVTKKSTDMTVKASRVMHLHCRDNLRSEDGPPNVKTNSKSPVMNVVLAWFVWGVGEGSTPIVMGIFFGEQ